MNWKIIENEYLDITNEEDDLILLIKNVIKNLREPEKIIFLKYVEEGTYAEVARLYNVTKPTAKKYILTVKDKILKEINKKYDNLYY